MMRPPMKMPPGRSMRPGVGKKHRILPMTKHDLNDEPKIHPPPLTATSSSTRFPFSIHSLMNSLLCVALLICVLIIFVSQPHATQHHTPARVESLKAARAFTGRAKIAKVEGAYHGLYDYAEVSQTSKPESWST